MKTFWNWFVVSQFPTLPHLTVITAIGLSLVFGAFKPLANLKAKDVVYDQEEVKKDYSASVLLISNITHLIAITMLLLMGWVFHFFV